MAGSVIPATGTVEFKDGSCIRNQLTAEMAHRGFTLYLEFNQGWLSQPNSSVRQSEFQPDGVLLEAGFDSQQPWSLGK